MGAAGWVWMCLGSGIGRRLLRLQQQRAHPGDIAARAPDLARVRQLLRGLLHAQLELRRQQFHQFFLQVDRRFRAQVLFAFRCFHLDSFVVQATSR